MGDLKKKILVTGTQGYIGSLMVPLLQDADYHVDGLDTLYYDRGKLYHDEADKGHLTVIEDIRKVTKEMLEGYDAVVLLAELSNDPAADLLDFEIAKEISSNSNIRITNLAKEVGVKQVIYMSSTSVYGIANDWVDETSETHPLTAYAKCKMLTENAILPLSDDNFTVTALRNSTTFGASPRQRFDVVLNNLSGIAHTTGVIAMNSDGSPWRPMVHALDTSRAVLAVLEADPSLVSGEVFNVGANRQNYTVREIAETVKKVYPECNLSFGEPDADQRSYRVKFDKIHNVLGYDTEWSLEDGAKQLREVFERVDLTPEMFQYSPFTRLKELKYLLETHQVDEDLYWKREGNAE